MATKNTLHLEWVKINMDNVRYCDKQLVKPWLNKKRFTDMKRAALGRTAVALIVALA